MDRTKVESRTSWAWMEDEHILKVKVKEDAVILLENAREDIAIGRQMTAGKPYIQMIIDVRGIRAISREARQYYIDPDRTPEEPNNNTAIAIVTGSAISRVVANFFISLNRPKVPVRLFLSESSAMKWLKSLAPAAVPQS